VPGVANPRRTSVLHPHQHVADLQQGPHAPSETLGPVPCQLASIRFCSIQQRAHIGPTAAAHACLPPHLPRQQLACGVGLRRKQAHLCHIVLRACREERTRTRLRAELRRHTHCRHPALLCRRPPSHHLWPQLLCGRPSAPGHPPPPPGTPRRCIGRGIAWCGAARRGTQAWLPWT
jgi:hypothetical protein